MCLRRQVLQHELGHVGEVDHVPVDQPDVLRLRLGLRLGLGLGLGLGSWLGLGLGPGLGLGLGLISLAHLLPSGCSANHTPLRPTARPSTAAASASACVGLGVGLG